MASRCRALSRPAINLFKTTAVKPSCRPVFSVQSTRATPSLFPRVMPQMGAVQSLLPLHSALSSARLTSCLGIDNCRSLSQGVVSLSCSSFSFGILSSDIALTKTGGIATGSIIKDWEPIEVDQGSTAEPNAGKQRKQR